MKMLRRHPIEALAGSWFILLGAFVPQAAMAHVERQSFFPQERVQSHPQYRPLINDQGQATPQTPRLVVCKKPGGEGVAAGDDSRSRIERIQDSTLRGVNLQLLDECQFEHLQAAVDAVTERGTTIYVLPGIYREEPSVRSLEENFGAAKPEDRSFCQAVLQRGPGKLSYEEQFRCPHIQNTVAIFGDPNFTDDDCGSDIQGHCTNPQTQACDRATQVCPYYDLQIEGTGGNNSDVIFEGTFIDQPGDDSDGQFKYLNGIRADRTDGIYLRNFTTQIYEFNAVYVIETDGYVLDRLLGRWVDEYSFLTFASDHGLYDGDEGYGAADSVLYPGSGSDLFQGKPHEGVDLRSRQATEIRNSKAHHAALGYSGTAGNAAWVHDTQIFQNQMGLATESIFGGHPGMPQDHALFENNLIFSNNKDYYRFVSDGGPCIDKPPRDRGVVPPEFRVFDALPPDQRDAILDRTVVCPPIPFPPGTAMLIGGGNYDVVQKNIVFDHWNRGFMLFHAPQVIRASDNPDTIDPANPFDTSHFNRFLENHFAEDTRVTPSRRQPNGADFWFDNSGVGNCWDGNTSFAGEVTADTGDPIRTLPGGPCPDGPLPNTAEQIATENAERIAFLVPCLRYDRRDPGSKEGCPFFDPITAPANREGSTGVTSLRPPQAAMPAGQTAKAGYFVLNNDTGKNQMLRSVTIEADGVLAALSGLRLSATVALNTVEEKSVTLNRVEGSNVFAFDQPVEIPAETHVLLELEAASGGAALARSGGTGIMLASGAGSAAFGMLLMAGGVRRRAAWLAVVTALCAAILASCDSNGGGGGGAGALPKGKVGFTLTALEIGDDSGPVNVPGLPLAIGSVEVQ